MLYNGIVALVLTTYNIKFTTDKPHKDAVHVFKFDTAWRWIRTVAETCSKALLI